MIKYLTFSVSISFISWIVGMILNSILIKTEYYKKISKLNFIGNKNIGVDYFKWIVKNTFFKFFNQKIKLKNNKMDLAQLREEMTVAELNHLIGFVFVVFVAVYKVVMNDILLALIIMVINVLMNLYPSLLQQENKKRIDKLIKRQV